MNERATSDKERWEWAVVTFSAFQTLHLHSLPLLQFHKSPTIVSVQQIHQMVRCKQESVDRWRWEGRERMGGRESLSILWILTSGSSFSSFSSSSSSSSSERNSYSSTISCNWSCSCSSSASAKSWSSIWSNSFCQRFKSKKYQRWDWENMKEGEFADRVISYFEYTYNRRIMN